MPQPGRSALAAAAAAARWSQLPHSPNCRSPCHPLPTAATMPHVTATDLQQLTEICDSICYHLTAHLAAVASGATTGMPAEVGEIYRLGSKLPKTNAAKWLALVPGGKGAKAVAAAVAAGGLPLAEGAKVAGELPVGHLTPRAVCLVRGVLLAGRTEGQVCGEQWLRCPFHTPPALHLAYVLESWPLVVDSREAHEVDVRDGERAAAAGR